MSKYEKELLKRAADCIQSYCANENGDMNDSLAMEIYAYLDAQTTGSNLFQEGRLNAVSHASPGPRHIAFSAE